MSVLYNVYCDESCHLENDHISTMALGAIWCASNDLPSTIAKIKEIKKKHGVSHSFEIKWTKISPAKKDFYIALINYFFDEPSLHFRSIIIPDKTKLNHGKFNQFKTAYVTTPQRKRQLIRERKEYLDAKKD